MRILSFFAGLIFSFSLFAVPSIEHKNCRLYFLNNKHNPITYGEDIFNAFKEAGYEPFEIDTDDFNHNTKDQDLFLQLDIQRTEEIKGKRDWKKLFLSRKKPGAVIQFLGEMKKAHVQQKIDNQQTITSITYQKIGPSIGGSYNANNQEQIDLFWKGFTDYLPKCFVAK